MEKSSYMLKYTYVKDILEKRGPYREKHLGMFREMVLYTYIVYNFMYVYIYAYEYTYTETRTNKFIYDLHAFIFKIYYYKPIVAIKNIPYSSYITF